MGGTRNITDSLQGSQWNLQYFVLGKGPQITRSNEILLGLWAGLRLIQAQNTFTLCIVDSFQVHRDRYGFWIYDPKLSRLLTKKCEMVSTNLGNQLYCISSIYSQRYRNGSPRRFAEVKQKTNPVLKLDLAAHVNRFSVPVVRTKGGKRALKQSCFRRSVHSCAA